MRWRERERERQKENEIERLSVCERGIERERKESGRARLRDMASQCLGPFKLNGFLNLTRSNLQKR